MLAVAVLADYKRCPKCDETKSLAEFTIRQRGKRAGQAVAHCKACNTRSWQERRARDKTLYRRIEWPSKLKRLYGITTDDYFRMLQDQGGGCAICSKKVPCVRRHKNRETEMFFVDHCHSTGKVRGLLCNACNRAIGYLADDPERVDRAAEYLRRNNS